jgi:hypothetical protein
MNHLLKKISFAGGKASKPKAQPAVLTPPIVGELKLAASYSYAEIIDLISDGPIEGVVNKNGLIANGLNMSQGIYLDDTSISLSNDSIISSTITQNSNKSFTEKSYNLSSAIKNITSFFGNIGKISNSIFENGAAYPSSLNSTINYYKVIPNDRYSQFNYNLRLNSAYKNSNVFGVDQYGNPVGVDYDKVWSAYKDYDTQYLQYVINGTNLIMTTWPFEKGLYNLNVASRYNQWSHELYYELNFSNQTFATNFYTNHIKIYIQSIIDRYNSTTTSVYEKNYIKKLLDKKFGESWTGKTVINLAKEMYGKRRDGDLFIIIKPQKDISLAGQNLLNTETNSLLDDLNFSLKSNAIYFTDSNVVAHDLFVPVIGSDGKTDGNVNGCYILMIGTAIKNAISEDYGEYGSGAMAETTLSIAKTTIENLSNISNIVLTSAISISPSIQNTEKYNFTNILTEFRNGDEFQTPLKYINKILIDKHYGSSLIGPFKLQGEVQRIEENATMLKLVNWNTPQNDRGLLPINEGSNDAGRITKKNYSNWNQQTTAFNENAIPIKHIVYNSNVTNFFVSIQIDQLSDQISQDVKNSSPFLTAGTIVPSIVNIEIETGIINENGSEKFSEKKVFQIVALVQGQTIIDLGSEDSAKFANDEYTFIKTISTSNNNKNVFESFKLPVLNEIDTSNGIKKRYIKVTKLSTETNSSLIKKDISLLKITEIIPMNLSYPFSALIGIKIDSRSFSSIPTRTYDCKLKKVKVPSNYKPCFSNGKDKRYYANINDYNAAKIKGDTLIYDNDWDGTFNSELQWTDNPAWIMYDLLTSQRYGLGQYIDSTKVDKWALYKIAKFCDAVDDNGYFIGVPDSLGGLEPRFSCNILFQEGTKIFDSLNVIASLFRGAIYYANSEIKFLDDRPKDPVALFTNSNVKDGFFNYTNYKRDEQFNAIEVVYIDRFENFLTKVEYVEDEEDIRKRGIFKKTINSLGVTSRAMARRIGQHLIFQTLKENQSISFTAGLESLLCRPGDLIIVEDELKSLKSNFGKVLSIDKTAKSLRLEDKFSNTDYTGKITVYTPTGYNTISDLNNINSLRRNRLTGFQLTGSFASPTYNSLTGNYMFSYYSNGFSAGITSLNDSLNNEYAVYTGSQSKYCYFSTGYTGWVFSTGKAFSDNNLYDKFITQNTGDFSFYSLNRGSGNAYSTSFASRRSGSLISMSGKFNNGIKNSTNGPLTNELHGLLDSEINISSLPQITTFHISGVVDKDYGCEVFVDQSDINYSLVPFVKEGSVYRFQRNNITDSVYKIIAIKEDNINEYTMIANKFNKDKYSLIENDITPESIVNNYSYSYNRELNGTTFSGLQSPKINSLITGIDAFQ